MKPCEHDFHINVRMTSKQGEVLSVFCGKCGKTFECREINTRPYPTSD